MKASRVRAISLSGEQLFCRAAANTGKAHFRDPAGDMASSRGHRASQCRIYDKLSNTYSAYTKSDLNGKWGF